MAIRTENLENGTVNVYTPYNREFVAAIKRIGGARWNAGAKAWNIPATGLEAARQYMLDIYGETDRADDWKRLKVKVVFTETVTVDRGAYTLFGKTLARAYGRDSGAKVGDDVILTSGEINSGGSAKNWTTVVREGATFTLVNVSEKLFNEKAEDWYYTAEVLSDTDADKRQVLITEKEKLLARLQEIEKELASI